MRLGSFPAIVFGLTRLTRDMYRYVERQICTDIHTIVIYRDSYILYIEREIDRDTDIGLTLT